MGLHAYFPRMNNKMRKDMVVQKTKPISGVKHTVFLFINRH